MRLCLLMNGGGGRSRLGWECMLGCLRCAVGLSAPPGRDCGMVRPWAASLSYVSLFSTERELLGPTLY